MSILQAQNINLSFGDRTILNNVSFTLGNHARAALAGGNGEGKSTLLKVVCGLMQSDGGSITKTKNMRVLYLPQSDIVFKDSTVYSEIEKAFDYCKANLDRQHEIESLLSDGNKSDTGLLEELNELQEALLDGPFYRREAIISSIAKGLGFKNSDLSRLCSEFSGGYQMRIALAKVLAGNPDLMMLDEPTNYLDIEARMFLKDFIKSFKGSLMIVCHDKGFLDDTVDEVYELFNSRLSRYSGNYSSYEKQRKMEIEQLESAYKRQQEEIDKTEQFIERFRYKATKAKQVQSRIKALEKLEPVVVPSHLKTLNFSFPEPPHSPNDMVVMKEMGKAYGNQVIFKGWTQTVTKGQRLAVTGHNGIGKSTLLRIIAGQDKQFTGTVKLGSGVITGYYAQDTADSLTMTNTVLEEVLPYGSEGQIRNALGSFLFSGDDIYKKVSVLSGGERSRLALLKILLVPANLLILDEPTNHLDINAKDMLLKALQNYTGTIIFVSHDAYFIKALADNILYLSESEPELFKGDYDYFEWKMASRLELQSAQEVRKPVSDINKENRAFKESFGFSQSSSQKEDRQEANKRRNRLQKIQREMDALIEKTDELEMKISETKALMNLAENYSNSEKIRKLALDLEMFEYQKTQAEEEWIMKSEELNQ